jgi:hypothetical protein
MRQNALLVCVATLLAAPARAQNSPATHPPDFTDFSSPRAVAAPRSPEVALATAVEHKRVADRRFWTFTGVNASLMVVDAELTVHCINTYPLTCREANPVMGSHPGRLRLYSIGGSVFAFQSLVSYAMRRRDPEGRLWMFPPIVGWITHGIGTAFGIRANINAPKLYR